MRAPICSTVSAFRPLMLLLAYLIQGTHAQGAPAWCQDSPSSGLLSGSTPLNCADALGHPQLSCDSPGFGCFLRQNCPLSCNICTECDPVDGIIELCDYTGVYTYYCSNLVSECYLPEVQAFCPETCGFGTCARSPSPPPLPPYPPACEAQVDLVLLLDRHGAPMSHVCPSALPCWMPQFRMGRNLNISLQSFSSAAGRQA